MAPSEPKTKRPIAEVRAELLASAETQRLAQTLGVGLEEYVEKVLAYYADPAKDAVISVAPDEQLRAAGVTPPNEREILDYLGKVERGEIDTRPKHQRDGFSAAEKEKVAGIGRAPNSPEPQAAGADETLKDQVQQKVKKDGPLKG